MTAERVKEIEDELCRAMEENLMKSDDQVEHFHYLQATHGIQELRMYLEEKEENRNETKDFL